MKTNQPAVLPQIIQSTISKALALLTATGCQFKVIAPDLSEYGELVLETKKLRKPNVNSFKQTGYVQLVKEQLIGEVKLFDTPSGTTPEQYRKAISGTAATNHGAGAYTTCIEGNTVQGLRLN